MKIYFAGIGGSGLSPLAELAKDAGFDIDGSNIEQTLGLVELSKKDIKYSLDQSGKYLIDSNNQQKIDWYVYTSAIKPDNLEFVTAQNLGLKMTKRDELLNYIINQKRLKLLAIAGTHGKTTTTAMVVWVFKQLGIPISYSIGSNISFGQAASYEAGSQYFAYECDEFDRNFLHFYPFASIITSLDYDHADTYPNEADYISAFDQFVSQNATDVWSYSKYTKALQDSSKLKFANNNLASQIKLVGKHNRENAYLVFNLLRDLNIGSDKEIVGALNTFPGTQRRFELISPNVYSDYAHHPSEIKATLQLASELGRKIIAVYQPHQNIRQHTLLGKYGEAFDLADKVYWLATYLSRENPNLKVLTPEDLIAEFKDKNKFIIADLNQKLVDSLKKEKDAIIIFMGAGSIDHWVRENF